MRKGPPLPPSAGPQARLPSAPARLWGSRCFSPWVPASVSLTPGEGSHLRQGNTWPPTAGRKEAGRPNPEAEVPQGKKACAAQHALARDKAGEARRCPGVTLSACPLSVDSRLQGSAPDPGGSLRLITQQGVSLGGTKRTSPALPGPKVARRGWMGSQRAGKALSLSSPHPATLSSRGRQPPGRPQVGGVSGLSSRGKEHRTHMPLGLRRGRQTPVSQEGCRRVVRGLPCPEERRFRAEDHAE